MVEVRRAADMGQPCRMCDEVRSEPPDVVDYVVAPAPGGGWLDWALALERVVRRMRHGPTRCLVITQDRVTERYVQLLVGHGWVHAEASSNVYLRGRSRLTDTHEALLARLGWIAPARTHDDPEEMPANWNLPLAGADVEGVVEVVLATIAGVFGFDDTRPVMVRSFAVDHPCRSCFPVAAA